MRSTNLLTNGDITIMKGPALLQIKMAGYAVIFTYPLQFCPNAVFFNKAISELKIEIVVNGSKAQTVG